jgi:hypothetical protein
LVAIAFSVMALVLMRVLGAGFFLATALAFFEGDFFADSFAGFAFGFVAGFVLCATVFLDGDCFFFVFFFVAIGGVYHPA